MTKAIIQERFFGKESDSYKLYMEDAEERAKANYFPSKVHWTNGSYTAMHFILAFVLCFVLIGFLAFLYMLVINPDGILWVTYEYENPEKVSNDLKEERADNPVFSH